MVNVDPVQFLVATVAVRPASSIPLPTPNIPINREPSTESIHLEWINANAPFLPKADLDAQGVS